MKQFLTLAICQLIFCSCDFRNSDTLFKLRLADDTGITFSNDLIINDSINGLTFEYIFNGGGVAVGDVNNDGLEDVFFAGNVRSSELYLNQGNLKFGNITEVSGTGTDRWCTGVSIIDINDDGLKDIYLCVAGIDKISNTRENLFFINNGIDSEGIPHFSEKGVEMGLNDDGYSTTGVFLDYDKDGDLDLFVLTNNMEGSTRSMLKPILKDGSGGSTDRLYRNQGNSQFTDVSHEAGILIEGYGLGVGVCDINQDGWPDIYCANDFISNDLLYVNNQNGTFSELSGKYFNHFTHNGMGMDISDFNNDGLLDVMVLDMLPPDNKRQKLMLASNRMTFQNSVSSGYHPQFLQNTLQLNRGIMKDGKPGFSEIARLSNVHETDWSWAPLFADFDNDGWKDLLITNGFRQDVTNLDYINHIIDISRFGTSKANKELVKQEMMKLPEVKLPNFIYRNKGDLNFEDLTSQWGLVHETFTNGTAFADFDNDGDLDIILNNIDQQVYLYENTLRKSEALSSGYLKMRFDKTVKDHQKIGAKTWVFADGKKQFIEYYPFRGYKSTMEEGMHFGLGDCKVVDSVIVMWPGWKVSKYYDISADTILYLGLNDRKDLKLIKNSTEDKDKAPTFSDVTDELNMMAKHKSNASRDQEITPTLLHSLTNYGPGMSVGDINNDGFEDIFVGADRGVASKILYQNQEGLFEQLRFKYDSTAHDMGSLLFDADNDGDLDLYVVSGGYHWRKGHEMYQDRIYLNDGAGTFVRATDALPNISSSGSCVVAADYDQDGDLDLFVGGRAEPRSYPLSPESYLLENENGVFKNTNHLLGDKNGKLGMVTSALWTDVNSDDKVDLIVVGEWMPVTILINESNKFVDKSAQFGTESLTGWWNSINGADLDNDGDTDYVLGNYGLNSSYKVYPQMPMEIYANDFDKNGSLDPVITRYIKEEKYIVHPLGILKKVIPGMGNRFRTFTEYGETPFKYSFAEEELQGAFHASANVMESVVLENVAGNNLNMRSLPIDVQFSPVFGSVIKDINKDGLQDIILVGNSLHEETITGYYNASFGNVLINHGDFSWNSIEPGTSNFVADGDKKALVQIISATGNEIFIVSENSGELQSFQKDSPDKSLTIITEQNDWKVTYQIYGAKHYVELHHGSGFISSSSRMLSVPVGAKNVVAYQYDGKHREIVLDNLVSLVSDDQ